MFPDLITTNLSRSSIATRLEPMKKDMSPDYMSKKIIDDKTNEISGISEIIKYDTKNKLNNVVVLADDKNYNRKFLQYIGMSNDPPSPFLCTAHIPTKLFTYQIYGLEETDKKIFYHVKSNAGLIIIISYQNYNKMKKMIEFYTQNIQHIPILIVIENCPTQARNEIEKENEMKNKMENNTQNVKYEFVDDKFVYTTHKSAVEINNIGWFNSQVINYKPEAMVVREKIVSTFPPTKKVILELEELVKEFVDCNLSIENWNHLNRLRLVYFSLKNFGYEKTIDQNGWLCVCWNRYKNTIGHKHLWNYTLTKFWIMQINSLMVSNPELNFAQIYEANSYLSDGNLHKKYYTNEVLFSDKARKEWVKPNLVSMH